MRGEKTFSGKGSKLQYYLALFFLNHAHQRSSLYPKSILFIFYKYPFMIGMSEHAYEGDSDSRTLSRFGQSDPRSINQNTEELS